MFSYGGIGAVSGAVIGGVTGMANAYLDNRNVWNGDEIAMGRSAFSFNNTDMPVDSYWGKGNRRFPQWYAKQLLSDDPQYEYIKYGDVVDENGCSVNGLSKIENYTFHSTQRSLPANVKGRAYLDIKDFGGQKVLLKIDGVVPRFDFKNGVYVIPQGSKTLSINIIADSNKYCNSVSPVKYLILGVKK